MKLKPTRCLKIRAANRSDCSAGSPDKATAGGNPSISTFFRKDKQHLPVLIAQLELFIHHMEVPHL